MSSDELTKGNKCGSAQDANSNLNSSALDIASLVIAITAVIYISGIGYTVGILQGLQIPHSIIDTDNLYGLLTSGFIALLSGINQSPLNTSLLLFAVLCIFYVVFSFHQLPIIGRYLLSFTTSSIIVFFVSFAQGLDSGETQLIVASGSLVPKSTSSEEILTARDHVSVEYVNSHGLHDSIIGIYLRSTNRFYYYYSHNGIVAIKADRIIKITSLTSRHMDPE